MSTDLGGDIGPADSLIEVEAVLESGGGSMNELLLGGL